MATAALGSSFSVIFFTVLLAIIPTTAWIGFYYWQYRKLSIPVLVSLGVFVMGGIAVLASILIQRPLLDMLSPITREFLEGRLVHLTGTEAVRSFVLAFLIAAPSEEITKMIGVMFLAYPNDKKFNRYFDGIVMGILAGLGFALIENIVYFYPLVVSGQYPVLIGSFILRFLVSTTAHSLYSGVAGFYIAKGKLTPKKRGLYFSLAFFIPVIMHGLFNFFLFTRIVYYALALVGVALFLMLRVTKNRKNLEVRKRRGKLVKETFFRDQAFEDQRNTAIAFFRRDQGENIADYKQGEVYNICPVCYVENKTKSNFCVNCHEDLIKKT